VITPLSRIIFVNVDADWLMWLWLLAEAAMTTSTLCISLCISCCHLVNRTEIIGLYAFLGKNFKPTSQDPQSLGLLDQRTQKLYTTYTCHRRSQHGNSPIRCKIWVERSKSDFCYFPKLISYHSNFPWATSKQCQINHPHTRSFLSTLKIWLKSVKFFLG